MLTAPLYASALKQVDPSLYPPDLAAFVSYLQDSLGALWDRLIAGELTPDAWYAAMLDNLTQSYTAAYMAGASSLDLTPQAIAEIANYVSAQAKFVSNFRFDIQALGDFLPGWRARAQSYAAGIAAPYWKGATQMLPLPAMPGDMTTQCGSNCHCNWWIDPQDEAAGDYDCYWELGVADHCQTCIERAARWSPLRIRDGRIQIGYEAPGTMEKSKENREGLLRMTRTMKHLVGQHDQHTHGNRGDVIQQIAPGVDIYEQVTDAPWDQLRDPMGMESYFVLPEGRGVVPVRDHETTLRTVKANAPDKLEMFGVESTKEGDSGMADAIFQKGLVRVRTSTADGTTNITTGLLDTPTLRKLQRLYDEGKLTVAKNGFYWEKIYGQSYIKGTLEDFLSGKNVVDNGFSATLKHLAGHHNQKRHGWRYSGEGVGRTLENLPSDLTVSPTSEYSVYSGRLERAEARAAAARVRAVSKPLPKTELGDAVPTDQWFDHYQDRTGWHIDVINADGSRLKDGSSDDLEKSTWAKDWFRTTPSGEVGAEAWKYKSEVAQQLAADTGVSPEIASDYIHQWAVTSNNHTYQALLTQSIISEEFGVEMSPWQKERWKELQHYRAKAEEHVKKGGRGIDYNPDTPSEMTLRTSFEDSDGKMKSGAGPYPNSKEATRAMVRAQYKRTQAALKEAGISEVILYRGVKKSEETHGHVKAGNLGELTENALESWSVDYGIANSFTAISYGKVGIVMGMKVPASRIFSTPKTGFGCLDEFEYTVLNGKNDAVRIVYVRHR